MIGAVRITDDDELLMMTAGGKLQRIAASEVSIVGRNTQGVRIMNLGGEDTLIAVKRVAKEEEAPPEADPQQAPAQADEMPLAEATDGTTLTDETPLTEPPVEDSDSDQTGAEQE